MKTGKSFRQHWESLDTAGKNAFLRSAAIRAVASREELPAIEYQEGPLTPLDIPRTAIIDQPGLYAVIYLGNLADLLERASAA